MKHRPFLKQVAKHFFDQHSGDLHRYRFYFQNRRAGLFFLHYLEGEAARAGKTIFLPEVTTLQEELYRGAGTERPDPNEELFILYEMFGAIEEEIAKGGEGAKSWERLRSKSFSDFYQLGSAILSDFNNIDHQLADAAKIYENARNLMEIDRQFKRRLTEDELRVLGQLLGKNFNPSVLGEGDMDYVKSFVSLFSLLSALYTKTKERLRGKGLFYPGMLIREAVEAEGGFTPDKEQSHIFVGLNALSEAERRLLELYRDKARTLFYWDYEGPVFRFPDDSIGLIELKKRNLQDFPMPAPGEEDYIRFDKVETLPRVEVAAIPSKVAQTVFVTNNRLVPLLREGDPAEKLSATAFEEKIRNLEVAVVLPNERLLMPLLSNLPGEVSAINVTMGYPLKETPLAGMCLRMMALFRIVRARAKGGKAEPFYLASEVMELLSMKALEPLIGASGLVVAVSKRLERDRLYILTRPDLERVWGDLESANGEDRSAQEALSFIRKIVAFPPEGEGSASGGRWLLDYFTELLSLLEIRLKADEEAANETSEGETKEAPEKVEESPQREEKEESVTSALTIYYFVRKLLEERITPLFEREGAGEAIDFRIMSDLLKALFSYARIPYEGEPLKGLQVLGILETRSLDFDTIFIPDASEGVLPAHTRQNTLIPEVIRIGNELPTYRWQEITRAYNFFRLISRASTVYAGYDSRKNENSDGEPSRYLRLLEYVYGPEMGLSAARRGTAAYRVQASETSLPELQTNPEAVAAFRQAVTDNTPDPKLLRNPIEDRQTTEETPPKRYRSISASALNTFLSCPKLFYYKYIERRKDDEPSDGLLEERDKGNLLHETLRRLYAPMEGKPLDTYKLAEYAKESHPIVRETLEAVFREDFGNMSAEGFNANELAVVEDLIRRVLRYDAGQLEGWIYVGGEVHFSGKLLIPERVMVYDPFTDSESLQETGKTLPVNVSGDIDRVLYHPGDKTLRLYDFKTGRDKNRSTVDQIESGNFEHVVSQLSFYALAAGAYVSAQNGSPLPLFGSLSFQAKYSSFPQETKVEAWIFKPIEGDPVLIDWGANNEVEDFMRQDIKPQKRESVNLLKWYSEEVVRSSIERIMSPDGDFPAMHNNACKYCFVSQICPQSVVSTIDETAPLE